VPKTGGTTLQHLLAAHFPEEAVCPAQDEPGLQALSDASLAHYRLFAGHFWSLPARLGSPLRMMTWLRDPLQRAVSMYKHILRDRSHALHTQAMLPDNLDALLAHPALRNSQVRHLARVHPHYQPGLDDADCLALACETLDACFFVGFSESYQRSTQTLFQLLGWEQEVSIPRLNTAEEYSPGVALDPSVEAALRKANTLDERLYAHARETMRGIA
jgi:hypothetical protein